jgi:hypothetical protein
MKNIWVFVLLGVGLVVGLVAPRPAFLQKPAQPVPDVKLEMKPEVKPEAPAPRKIEEPKRLPEGFALTEKDVVSVLGEGSVVVKDWEWKFSPLARVEFVSKTPLEDNKVDVVVRLDDIHWGILNVNGMRWNGLVKLHYDGVVSDKKELVLFVKSAEVMSFKKTAVVRSK